MTPPLPPEKTAALSFRVTDEIPEMLRELADDASVSMTDYVTALIRTAYRHRFPAKASAHETPIERLERQLFSQTSRQGKPQGRKRGNDLALLEAALPPKAPKRK
jgi:hypothetical protein